MAILNPTLSDAGPTPGSAAHWTLNTHCQRESIAAFGPAPERGWEAFNWSSFVPSFVSGMLAQGIFDGVEGYEDFEEAWNTGPFLFAFPESLLDACRFGGGNVEAFESGWLSSPYVDAWDDVTSVAGLFSGVPRETFDWAALAAPSFASALFDGGTAPAETFSGSWSPLTSY